MTNDASRFPYHDNLQVLNDNRLEEAQETGSCGDLSLRLSEKRLEMAQSKRLLRTITERKCPLASIMDFFRFSFFTV